MTPTTTIYNDWRDTIAAEFSTLGPIPEHPFAEPGLWVDSGIRTADDALRAVIEIAESWGWNPLAGSASEDRESDAELLAESGWVDLDRFPDGPDILVDIADAAESFINAVLSAYGFDPEPYRGYLAFGDDIHPNHPLGWYAGWDGDIGGFGLWVVPDDEWDETNANHVWGKLERSPIAGTLHRKCVVWGCRVISALDDSMDIGCVICGREPSIGAIGEATYCEEHGLAVLRGLPPVATDEPEPELNVCPYCKLADGSHRASAFTANGSDLERFDRVHSKHERSGLLLFIVGLCIAAGAWMDPAPVPATPTTIPTTTAPVVEDPDVRGIAFTITNEPQCWEDEVRVVVYYSPYEEDLVGTVGCVPADNLPVSGYRP